MHFILKYMLWVAGIFSVLLILGSIALQIFLSSEEAIKFAETKGEEILGRGVSIEQLDLGLFGIKARGITIDSKEEVAAAQKKPFVRFSEADVLVDPSSLLYGHVNILRLTVKKVSIRIHRDEKGRLNFQDIIDNLNRGEREPNLERAGKVRFPSALPGSAEAAENGSPEGAAGFALTIRRLKFYDVTSELQFDASADTPALEAACFFAHIAIAKIKAGEPVDVSFDGKCRDSSERELFQSKGDAHIDTDKKNYRVSLEMSFVDLPSIFEMAPASLGENCRFRKGTFAGSLELARLAGEPITWNLDLEGEALDGSFRINNEAKWQRLRLPSLRLKTQGRYSPGDDSVHVESFLAETPFASAHLTKPSFWNIAAKDEAHVKLNVRDMGEAGRWVSQLTDVPIQAFRKNTTAQMTVSIKRDRRAPEGGVSIVAVSRFDPVAVDAVGGLISLPGNVSKIKGNMGGQARVTYVSGKRVEWHVDLKADQLSANLRVNKKRRWAAVRFGESTLRSKGSFDTRKESARIDTLEVELPSAKAVLQQTAKWNVGGEDAVALSIDVRNVSLASDLLNRLGFPSLGSVPAKAKMLLAVAASRNRKTSSAFKIDANAHFESIPFAAPSDLAPLSEHVRPDKGELGGTLRVSWFPKGDVRWNADVTGKNIGVKIRNTERKKWKDVSLGLGHLQSRGSYSRSEDSFEIQKFVLALPFARAHLNHASFWNRKGKDGFSLTLDVMDADVVEALVGKFLEYPVQGGSKGKKARISLTGKRDRRTRLGFSYKGTASFAPLEIGTWLRFVNFSAALRNLGGEIAGKGTFSYVPQKRLTWNLALRSDDLRGEFLAQMGREWRRLRTGKVAVQSVGSYDFRNKSARLRSLDFTMPFGLVRMVKPGGWNMNGLSAGQLRWNISDLAGASKFAGDMLGAPASKLLMGGTASGFIDISRSKAQRRSPKAVWAIDVDLGRLSHADFPNLVVSGSVQGRSEEGVLNIHSPELTVTDSSRIGGEPDVVLKNLGVRLDRTALVRGEIRAPSIQVKTLQIRYLYDHRNRSNLDSLLYKPREGQRTPLAGSEEEGKTRPGREPSALPSHTESGAALEQPERGAEEASRFPLPVIEVGRFEIERMKFHFEDVIAKDKPPVVLNLPDASVLMTNFDTRMSPKLRKTRLELKTLGGMPSVLVRAALNPASVPPNAEGAFRLSRFDLRKVSPYARDMEGESLTASLIRGSRITKGDLNFNATLSLRNNHLDLKGRAEIVGLELKPDEAAPLSDFVRKMLRESVLRLFKRENDTIALNVRVSGRLDDPRFHVLDAIVEPIFLGLFGHLENIGSNVKDIVTGILDTAIGGVKKIVPGEKGDSTPLDKSSPQGTAPAENQLEKLGKEFEKTLKKGLRFFGFGDSK